MSPYPIEESPSYGGAHSPMFPAPVETLSMKMLFLKVVNGF